MTTKIIWGNFVQISQVPEISTVFLKETDFSYVTSGGGGQNSEKNGYAV